MTWKLIENAPRSSNDAPLPILLARYIDGVLYWMAEGTIYKRGWVGGSAVHFTSRSGKRDGYPTHWQELPSSPII